jgi:hypothetical protein
MENMTRDEEIQYHLTALKRLGFVVREKKPRVLGEKGLRWKESINHIKNLPENKGKNMRDIYKLASEYQKNSQLSILPD